MLINIAIPIGLILFGLWFVITLRSDHSRFYGIIKPQKPKQKPLLHTCKFPFFGKPIGTLYRCKHCGNVWRLTCLTSDPYWKAVSLDDWKSAGGSSME